jgi:hypothetical protein
MRDVMPDEHTAFCGKFLLQRPMLISLDYLPHFLVIQEARSRIPGVRRNSGDPGPNARVLLEQLRKKSPQSTHSLRQRMTLANGAGRNAFDLAMTELQIRLQITSLEDQGRLPSSLWKPVSGLFRNQLRRARRIPVDEARRVILERYFRNQFVVTVADIRRLFRWERQDIFKTLGELISRGIVTPEVQVEGIADRTYCLLT